MVGFFRKPQWEWCQSVSGFTVVSVPGTLTGCIFYHKISGKKNIWSALYPAALQELSEWYCLHKPHLAFPSITRAMGDAMETQYVRWNDIAGCQEDWDTSTGIGFKINTYPEKSEYTSLCRIKWLVKWLVCYFLASVWVRQLVLPASALQMIAWLDCSIRTATSSVGREGEHWSWSPHGIHPHSS